MFQQETGRISVPSERLWRLKQALQHAASRRYLTGRQMSRLIGHNTWASLVRRPGLAEFSSAYRFASDFDERTGEVWPSVATELRQAASLLPLLFADSRRPWHGRIYASDAEGSNSRDHGGFGVCYRDVEPQAAAQAGRIADKWRYSCEEFVSARRHALDLEHRFLEDQLVSSQAGSFHGRRPSV